MENFNEWMLFSAQSLLQVCFVYVLIRIFVHYARLSDECLKNIHSKIAFSENSWKIREITYISLRRTQKLIVSRL